MEQHVFPSAYSCAVIHFETIGVESIAIITLIVIVQELCDHDDFFSRKFAEGRLEIWEAAARPRMSKRVVTRERDTHRRRTWS